MPDYYGYDDFFPDSESNMDEDEGRFDTDASQQDSTFSPVGCICLLIAIAFWIVIFVVVFHL